ncbi:MAG: hypothetical protein FE044_01125 [Thermoplasmata archaeon]|nr:MAG: hypothetical protein FE044_01125 [Thermoplasmata archaeon]
MKIGCIGSEDMVTIMRLAGAAYCEVAGEGKNLEKQFDEMVEKVDLVVIEERYAEKIKDKILYFRLIHDKPVIVEVPGREEIEKEDTIRKIIIRAIGVDMGD